MRWSLISLIAAALPAVAAARYPGDAESGEPDTEHEPMTALTRPELLRLLRAFVLPQHVPHRSHWRRRHQPRATTCHRYWNEVTAAA